MVRFRIWCTLTLVAFVAAAPPARAAEAYQVATISSLLAGGYDGDTTVGEMLRHGDFGLGTFNGVDGEMMVLDAGFTVARPMAAPIWWRGRSEPRLPW